MQTYSERKQISGCLRTERKKELPKRKRKFSGDRCDHYLVFGSFPGYSLNIKFLICQVYINKAEKN